MPTDPAGITDTDNKELRPVGKGQDSTNAAKSEDVTKIAPFAAVDMSESSDVFSARDEGTSLSWHLDNSNTYQALLDKTVNMVGLSKFARGTLSKAVSTNIRVDDNDTTTWEWTRIATTPATYIKSAMLQVLVEECLLRGIRVTKVTTYGKFKARVLTISQDRFALFCTHHKVRNRNRGTDGVLSSVARKLPLPLISRKGVRGFSNADLRELYVRYIDIADIDYINVGYPCTRKLEFARRLNRLEGYQDRIDTYRDQIVSISHHGGETLDVFIPNANERNLLVSTLLALRQKYHTAKVYVVNEARLLRYIWYDADKNRDGCISEKEFERMVNRINLPVTAPRRVYATHRKENHIHGPLTYAQCMTLLHYIKEGKYNSNPSSVVPSNISSTISSTIPTAISSNLPSIPGTYFSTTTGVKPLPHMVLWDSLFGTDKDYVTAQEFRDKFLHSCQKEMDATVRDVKALFTSINRMEVSREEALSSRKNCLSRYRFASYLHHVFNMAFDPDETELNPELMTRPLTEYWINSSHNTYLSGDQLQSISSVEMYMVALHRGCVCLELDCWDGEKNTETGEPIPILYHGGTITTKILFEDVIVCVDNFVTHHPDTYPIILSLENHCSAPYQKVMVQLMRDILKDKLYAPFARDSKERLDENAPLPSPAQLKGRVVIKGKRPAMNNTVVTTGTQDDDDDDDDDDYADGDPTNEDDLMSGNFQPKVVGVGTKGRSSRTTTNNPAINNNKSQTVPSKPTEGSHGKGTIQELAEITLFHGVKHKSWETSISSPPSHMHSIGENKITKLIQKKGGASDWRTYNQTHMTRTYPAGTRVDSSNYNPILAWSMGCQIVALNFQTSDTALILNDGRFRQNGKCGYVLKPQGLVQGPLSTPMTIKVRILCGSCIPKPRGAKTGEKIDPYVQIRVHDVVRSNNSTTVESGTSHKEVSKTTSHATTTVYDNGFCPIWNEEIYHEFEVYSPFVAMIQFSVWETDVGRDDRVGDATIPINCLRRGYRSILLHDNKSGIRTGPFGFATLLADIRY